MTLTEFLLARIAEDEAVVRSVEADNLSQGPVSVGDDPWPSERAFAEHFTPARVLARCEADRRIVERCSAVDYAMPSAHLAHGVLAELALTYADHPDFDEAWRA